MFLSKLVLDARHPQVRKEMVNRYELHRTISSAFSGDARPEIGLLYRLEISPQLNSPLLLVQSLISPDWTALHEKGCLVCPAEVKHFEPQFSAGQIFIFRLVANPTVRKKQEQGESNRVGLYKEQQQIDWLSRKAIDGGFKLIEVRALQQGVQQFEKRKDRKAHKVQNLSVCFEGRLQVVDVELFQKTFCRGIGSAKGFGFGLLSLARS